MTLIIFIYLLLVLAIPKINQWKMIKTISFIILMSLILTINIFNFSPEFKINFFYSILTINSLLQFIIIFIYRKIFFSNFKNNLNNYNFKNKLNNFKFNNFKKLYSTFTTDWQHLAILKYLTSPLNGFSGRNIINTVNIFLFRPVRNIATFQVISNLLPKLNNYIKLFNEVSKIYKKIFQFNRSLIENLIINKNKFKILNFKIFNLYIIQIIIGTHIKQIHLDLCFDILHKGGLIISLVPLYYAPNQAVALFNICGSPSLPYVGCYRFFPSWNYFFSIYVGRSENILLRLGVHIGFIYFNSESSLLKYWFINKKQLFTTNVEIFVLDQDDYCGINKYEIIILLETFIIFIYLPLYNKTIIPSGTLKFSFNPILIDYI